MSSSYTEHKACTLYSKQLCTKLVYLQAWQHEFPELQLPANMGIVLEVIVSLSQSRNFFRTTGF